MTNEYNETRTPPHDMCSMSMTNWETLRVWKSWVCLLSHSHDKPYELEGKSYDWQVHVEWPQGGHNTHTEFLGTTSNRYHGTGMRKTSIRKKQKQKKNLCILLKHHTNVAM